MLPNIKGEFSTVPLSRISRVGVLDLPTLENCVIFLKHKANAEVHDDHVWNSSAELCCGISSTQPGAAD